MTDPDWAVRHCAEPAVDAVNAAAGRDVWDEVGGCPRSWREAAALYRRLGVTSLFEAVTKVCGAPISPRLAMRGDVVMVRGALGVCRGELAECMGASVPMREVAAAWSARAATG